MSFTKEAGVLLYNLGWVLYLTFYVLRTDGALRQKLLGLRWIAAFIIPDLAFLGYLWGRHSSGAPLMHVNDPLLVIKTFLDINLLDPVFFSQLATVLLINFHWVMTLVVLLWLLALLAAFAFNQRLAGLAKVHGCHRWFFTTLLIFSAYAVARFPYFVNQRYFIAVVPLLVLTFLIAITTAPLSASIRRLLLITAAGLTIASAFRTFDPLAIKLFGTFPFGQQQMLNMDSIAQVGFNRDELVYNLEFTELGYLLDLLLQKVGADKDFLMHRQADWYLFNYADPNENRRARMLLTARAIKLHLAPGDIDSLAAPEFYFIEVPNIPARCEYPEINRMLAERFKKVAAFDIQHNGYALRVSRWSQKEAAGS